MKKALFSLFALSAAASPLLAAPALSSYTNYTTYTISVPEASAVTYNRDTGTLFAIGDEGAALTELSLTGETLSSMRFNNAGNPDTRTMDDPEGITYLGNNTFMIGTERNGMGWIVNYAAGTEVGPGRVLPGHAFTGAGGGNIGLEGVAYDPITNTVWGVKQVEPVSVWRLNEFDGEGPSFVDQPFANRRFTNAEITNLSDIYILASSGAFAEDDPRRMNILFLDRYSKKIYEMTRAGALVDTLDFSFMGRNAVEGITMDDNGILYLVSEGETIGGTVGSGLHVLTAVPEPSTYALIALGGLALWAIRRRQRRA